MKDVMDAAEELKNGVQGPCIQKFSVVDVSLGKVSILALSADSSMLAASVGLNIYFFSVDALLNKVCSFSFISLTLILSAIMFDLKLNYGFFLDIKVHTRGFISLFVIWLFL